MGARQKLNDAYGCGILLIALLLAGLFQSWIVFLIVVAVLTATAIDNGAIRPRPRRQ